MLLGTLLFFLADWLRTCIDLRDIIRVVVVKIHWFFIAQYVEYRCPGIHVIVNEKYVLVGSLSIVGKRIAFGQKPENGLPEDAIQVHESSVIVGLSGRDIKKIGIDHSKVESHDETSLSC
jgi:hypothetical protein